MLMEEPFSPSLLQPRMALKGLVKQFLMQKSTRRPRYPSIYRTALRCFSSDISAWERRWDFNFCPKAATKGTIWSRLLGSEQPVPPGAPKPILRHNGRAPSKATATRINIKLNEIIKNLMKVLKTKLLQKHISWLPSISPSGCRGDGRPKAIGCAYGVGLRERGCSVEHLGQCWVLHHPLPGALWDGALWASIGPRGCPVPFLAAVSYRLF